MKNCRVSRRSSLSRTSMPKVKNSLCLNLHVRIYPHPKISSQHLILCLASQNYAQRLSRKSRVLYEQHTTTPVLTVDAFKTQDSFCHHNMTNGNTCFAHLSAGQMDLQTLADKKSASCSEAAPRGWWASVTRSDPRQSCSTTSSARTGTEPSIRATM